MRTLGIIALTLIIVALVAFLAIPGLWSHGKQWRREVGTAIDKASPDEHIAGIYEAALSDAGKKLCDYYQHIFRIKTEIAKIEATKQAQEEKLAKEERILQRAQELLKKHQPGATIAIGGTAYTWEQVNNDALKRVSTCQVLRRNILTSEQSLSKLRKAYTNGLDQIRKAKAELQKKKLEFEAEKAELTAYRAQEKVNELIGRISITAPDIKTDLGRARRAFEERLNEVRARAEYTEEIGPSADVVATWDIELGIPEEKAADAIKAYFQEKESKPVKTPDVGAALEALTTATP